MSMLTDAAGLRGKGGSKGGGKKDESDHSLYGTLKKIRNSGQASSGSSGHAEPELESYHSGGKVRKTGPARLKKGETVLTKGQMKEMKRKGKKRGKKRGGKKR